MELLYKYRHFSDNNHLRLLTHGELRFTPPLEFNDPHDCRIPIRWDKAERSWLESEIQAQALRQDADEDETAREAKVKETLADMLDSGSRNLLLEYQTRKVISPKVGVIPFSLEAAHPLLWAHYADSHKGFAVGFDQSKLLEAIRSISGVVVTATSAPATPGLEIRPARLNYSPTMPELVPRRGNEADLYRTIVTTKSREWEYEKEVRYILMKLDNEIRPMRLMDAERIVSFPLDAIEEVILGVNASDSDAQRVVEILSDGRPRVRLWKASPSYGTYGLDREEIVY